MIAHRKGSEIWLLVHIFFCHFLHRVQGAIVAHGEPEVSKTKMLLGAGHRLLEVDRCLEHQTSACSGVGQGRQLVGCHRGAVEQLAWQTGKNLRTAALRVR